MPEDTEDIENPASPQRPGLGRFFSLGLGGGKGTGGLGGGKGLPGIVMAVGGKKFMIPAAIILVLLFGAVFFLITAVAVYATRLGAIPGYSGGIGGSCSASTNTNGIPVGATVSIRDNIPTTQFGGGSDPGDSGNPGFPSTGATPATQWYAALPSLTVKTLCTGESTDPSTCARIKVVNPKNNKSVVLAIVDSGPCNWIDDDYVLKGARPMVEQQPDNSKYVGRCSSQNPKAALDISPWAMKELGGDDFNKFSWTFTNDGLGPCAQTTGGGPVDTSNLASWYYNQGAEPWGPLNGQCQGWPERKIYRRSGCWITSVAMVAKFYGKNLNPYETGQLFCDNTGSPPSQGHLDYNASVASKIIGKSTDHKKNPSVDDLNDYLKKGLVIARTTQGAFGGAFGHFLVIAAVGGDSYLTNDPSNGNGGAAKSYPLTDFTNHLIDYIDVFY